MKKILDAYEAFEYGYDEEEITEDEYKKILEGLVSELIGDANNE